MVCTLHLRYSTCKRRVHPLICRKKSPLLQSPQEKINIRLLWKLFNTDQPICIALGPFLFSPKQTNSLVNENSNPNDTTFLLQPQKPLNFRLIIFHFHNLQLKEGNYFMKATKMYLLIGRYLVFIVVFLINRKGGTFWPPIKEITSRSNYQKKGKRKSKKWKI